MKRVISFANGAVLCFGALLVFMTTSCDVTDSKKPNPTPPDPFPNSVGSWWVYERIDSLTMVTDTLTVIVRDTFFTCKGGVANLWRFLSRRPIMDGNMVRRSNDTVTLCDGGGNGEQFILPFVLNKGWRSQVNNGGDTSTVDSIVTVTVPAGLFDNVAVISRTVRIGFEGAGGRHFTEIASNVGIVRRTVVNWGADGGGTIDTAVWDSWTLLDYSIVEATEK